MDRTSRETSWVDRDYLAIRVPRGNDVECDDVADPQTRSRPRCPRYACSRSPEIENRDTYWSEVTRSRGGSPLGD